MKNFDSKLLRKFLDQAGANLKGRWLLVGGTLLPAVGIDVRSTIDIDLVGLGESELAQNLELMELAEQIGLDVAAVNQAASFFVHKLKPKDSDVIVLSQGKSATIYRPTIELYIRLKSSRMTESDLMDCQHYFNYCKGQKDKIHQSRIEDHLEHEIAICKEVDKRNRLKALLATCARSLQS